MNNNKLIQILEGKSVGKVLSEAINFSGKKVSDMKIDKEVIQKESSKYEISFMIQLSYSDPIQTIGSGVDSDIERNLYDSIRFLVEEKKSLKSSFKNIKQFTVLPNRLDYFSTKNQSFYILVDFNTIIVDTEEIQNDIDDVLESIEMNLGEVYSQEQNEDGEYEDYRHIITLDYISVSKIAVSDITNIKDQDKSKPAVRVTGSDGNIYTVLATCISKGKDFYSKIELDAIKEKVMKATDYSTALQILLTYFDLQ